MNNQYRFNLNRYLPAADPGHALLVPNPEIAGKFRILENTERFARKELFKTEPIGRLVDTPGHLPWKSPTVIQPGETVDASSGANAKPVATSDYRYLQHTASRGRKLPVLHFHTGWIYNLAHVLDAIDILDYRRLLTEAARISSIPTLTSTLGSGQRALAAGF